MDDFASFSVFCYKKVFSKQTNRFSTDPPICRDVPRSANAEVYNVSSRTCSSLVFVSEQ